MNASGLPRCFSHAFASTSSRPSPIVGQVGILKGACCNHVCLTFSGTFRFGKEATNFAGPRAHNCTSFLLLPLLLQVPRAQQHPAVSRKNRLRPFRQDLWLQGCRAAPKTYSDSPLPQEQQQQQHHHHHHHIQEQPAHSASRRCVPLTNGLVPPA